MMNISENVTDIINGTRIDMDQGHFNHLTNLNPLRNLNITMADALIRSFGLAIACTGMLCNFFVLKSLIAVRSEQLKSKLFILNMIFSDFLLPPFSSLDIIRLILYSYGMKATYLLGCVTILTNGFESFALYYQSLASLVLACDRLYAIITPMKYYTDGYPRWLVVCIIGGTWIIPLSLVLPVFIISSVTPLRLKVAGSGICYKLVATSNAWLPLVKAGTGILLTIGIVTFCIYILLFLLLKLVIRSNMTGVQSTDRKTFVSQTVTYFIVHCTSLVFFLPRPLYSELLLFSSSQLNKTTRNAIRRSLVLVYHLNSIIDPIVLSLRIPAIKEKLYLNLGFKLSHPRSKGAEMMEPSTKQESLTIA